MSFFLVHKILVWCVCVWVCVCVCINIPNVPPYQCPPSDSEKCTHSSIIMLALCVIMVHHGPLCFISLHTLFSFTLSLKELFEEIYFESVTYLASRQNIYFSKCLLISLPTQSPFFWLFSDILRFLCAPGVKCWCSSVMISRCPCSVSACSLGGSLSSYCYHCTISDLHPQRSNLFFIP